MFEYARHWRTYPLFNSSADPDTMLRRPTVAAWQVCLALSMVGIVAFLMLPFGTLLQAGAFMVVQVVAAIVSAAAVARSSRRDRWIWGLLSAGLVLNALGDVAWYVVPLANNTQPPFPSISDAAFLGANTAWLVAIAILIRRRSRGRLVVTLLDALIVASGLGALSYLLLIQPALHSEGHSMMTLTVALAYPLLDIALFASAACLTTFKEGRSTIVWLLVMGVGNQLIGDSLFAHVTLSGSFRLGHWLMGAWLLGYGLVAAASLHPGRESISRPPVEGPVTETHSARLVGLGAAALVVPGVLLQQTIVGEGAQIDVMAVLSGLSALVFVLILTRLAVVLGVLARSEQRSRDLALHDALTGLPNRKLLIDRTDQAIAAAPRRQQAISLLMIDLDSFKKVNDELGHGAGDDLLRHVAHCLTSVIRPSDTAARLGGDEFCVLLADADEDGARHVAKRIVAAVADPSEHRESQIPVLASIGIATFRGGNKLAEDLILDADDALYAAKNKVSLDPGARSVSSGQHEFFAQEMRDARTARVELEKHLRVALTNDEFRLVYQPKVSLATDRMIGVEALLRWQHPVRGLVPPLDFIPLAEETGIIVPVGAWVLDQACAQGQRWRDASPGTPPLSVAVNLSARQFDSSLARTVSDSLARSHFDPTLLCLEVTESMVMRDPNLAIAILGELRDLGVRISVDDFGTGYSSLAYLKRLPLDELKIDKTFVDDLGRDPEATAIVAAVMGMAHALDLTVVAEGVETIAQRTALITLGCDEAQGYYYAPPRGAEAVDRLQVSVQGWADASAGAGSSTIDTRHHQGTILQQLGLVPALIAAGGQKPAMPIYEYSHE